MNLGNIKSEVAAMANRTDLEAVISTYVHAAILEIHQRNDLRMLAARATHTITGNETVEVGKSQITNPTNFKNMRRVFYLVGGVRQYGIPFMLFDQLERIAAFQNATPTIEPPYIEIPFYAAPTVNPGQPIAIAADRASLWVAPELASSEVDNVIEMNYALVDDYSDQSASYEPALLQNGWPAVMFRALVYVAQYLKDDEREKVWQVAYDRANASLLTYDASIEGLSTDRVVMA